MWTGGFFLAAKSFGIAPVPSRSEQTLDIQEHFRLLANQQRRQLALDAFYAEPRTPSRVVAIVEFTKTDPVEVRSPRLDGFLTQHVNISRDNNGVVYVFGVFSRPAPYLWPRTLDVDLGGKVTARADLDDNYSSQATAFYRISSHLSLSMTSPNGHFTWTTTKENSLLNSPDCLYRQDLYKEGEYYKSLAAVATHPLLIGPQREQDPTHEPG
jgi:hypothetical protein